MMGNKSFVFRFADIEVHEREFSLIKGGEALPVEPKAFRVLLILLRNPQKLITKEELLNAVWGDVAVGDNSLARSIALIRRLLGDDTRNPRYIETVATVGYRFIQGVEVSADPVGELAAPDLPRIIPVAGDDEAPRSATVSVPHFLDSIAVLPFEDVEGPPELEYLSDGMTTSLIDKLSQLNGLHVVPRTTVFRYKGKKSDIAAAGHELRVRVVLTGTLIHHSGGMTIRVELIDSASESHLWGANFNATLEELLAVQAEIAAAITNKLRLRLNDEERRQLARPPTKSREAYHLYLKAMHWANKWTPEGGRKGAEYIRQAIDADPVFAVAWAALAYLYVMLGFSRGAPPTEAFPKAKAAALKALEIDEGVAEAHVTLGFVRLVYDWDWLGAHEAMLRTVELAPNLSDGHSAYSMWYLTQGLFAEALAEAKLALVIDPLAARFSFQAGWVLYFSRLYDQAIEQFHKSIELDPLFPPAHQFLAFAYAQKGMRHNAVAELEKGLEFAKDDIRSKALWGIVDALTGEPAAAREVLASLRPEVGPPNFAAAYHCAVLCALLGEKDEAFACLEMARLGRAIQLIYLAIAPNFDRLRDDPRFPILLRRIGIPAPGVRLTSHSLSSHWP
jgi:TolB-like protein/DNA-binding winged helix-turn-helix (wHTH) protein